VQQSVLQRFLRFTEPAELAERSRHPAVSVGILRIRPDNSFCRLDRGFVVAAKIMADLNGVQTPRLAPGVRVEPRRCLERSEPLLWVARVDQHRTSILMRLGQARRYRQRPLGLSQDILKIAPSIFDDSKSHPRLLIGSIERHRLPRELFEALLRFGKDLRLVETRYLECNGLP